MIADQFLESNLWNMLWSRVAQSLKPELSIAAETTETNEVQAVVLKEDSAFRGNENESLDWTLISPNGYLHLLQLASKMLTISTQTCVSLILKEDDLIMFDTLSCMLSERFLNSIKIK